MIIQNYGLHWRRERVNWGSHGRGNAGDLLGRLARSAKSAPVNFRTQTGIYILHDGFRVVYVGQAGRGSAKLFARLKGRTRNHLAERWDRFSWFGVYPVGSSGELIQDEPEDAGVQDTLDHLEGVIISVTEPPLNRQGARFGSAEQYRQHKTEINEIEDEEDED